MDIIMIPTKSHLTSMGEISYTRCPSLKTMQPKQKNNWNKGLASANEEPCK